MKRNTLRIESSWSKWMIQLVSSPTPLELLVNSARERDGVQDASADWLSPADGDGMDRQTPNDESDSSTVWMRAFENEEGHRITFRFEGREEAWRQSDDEWLTASVHGAFRLKPVDGTQQKNYLRILESLDHAVRGKMNLVSLTLSALGYDNPNYSGNGQNAALARLVTVPRTVSRYLSETLELSREAVSPSAAACKPRSAQSVARSVENLCRSFLRQRKQRLELEIETALTLQRSAELCQRALLALVQSCSRCAPPSTVLTLRLARREQTTFFEIEDEGPAIPSSACADVLKAHGRRPGVSGTNGVDAQRALASLLATRVGGRLEAVGDDERLRFRLQLPS